MGTYKHLSINERELIYLYNVPIPITQIRSVIEVDEKPWYKKSHDMIK